MACEVSSGSRQSGGGWRSAVHVPALSAGAVEVDPNNECDRTSERGVPPSDQDAVVLPSGETVCMLFWALLASGQIVLRRVDGWETLAVAPTVQPLDFAA